MSKKKEYENIFVRMAESHNKIVPLIRDLGLSTVKVKNRRIIQLRDFLEGAEDIMISLNLFTEYLITNSFILDYIDKSSLEECYNLIKTKEKSNTIIGITTLYNLIEEKKVEITSKLNEKDN